MNWLFMGIFYQKTNNKKIDVGLNVKSSDQTLAEPEMKQPAKNSMKVILSLPWTGF